MTTFNSKDKTWSCYADPKADLIPIGSYLGITVLKQLERRDPNDIAYFNHDTGENITIKDIHERTVSIAKNLQTLGIGKDDIIGLFSRYNSYSSSIAFASSLNGNAWCPFDTNQDDSGLDYLFDYIRPTILIYDKEYESAVKQSLDRLKQPEVKIILVFGDPLAENSIENVLLKKHDISNFEPFDLSQYVSPDNLTSCIYFSSGTTGKPKGAIITDSMIVNILNAHAGINHYSDPNANMLMTSTLRWLGQLSGFYFPLFVGSKRTFTGKDVTGENICKAIDKWKVNILHGPNQILGSIFDHYIKNPGYDLKSLRVILTRGETPSKAMNDKFRRILPNITINYGYGLTEASGSLAMQDDLDDVNGGHLLKGFSLRVVDQNGKILGPGLPGIVHIKSRVKFQGYFKNDEATKKAITDDGWFISGDYGLVTKENHLHIFCRFKNILNFNGKTIIPFEVEEHLNRHKYVDVGWLVPFPEVTPNKTNIYVKFKENLEINENEATRQLLEYLKEIIDLKMVAKFDIVKHFEVSSSTKSRIIIS